MDRCTANLAARFQPLRAHLFWYERAGPERRAIGPGRIHDHWPERPDELRRRASADGRIGSARATADVLYQLRQHSGALLAGRLRTPDCDKPRRTVRAGARRCEPIHQHAQRTAALFPAAFARSIVSTLTS